jgi:hypothetical protein
LRVSAISHPPAVGGDQHAGITGLAAAQRVEHGAVEHDARLVHRQHGGLAVQQRGVFAEQFFGHVDEVSVTSPSPRGC